MLSWIHSLPFIQWEFYYLTQVEEQEKDCDSLPEGLYSHLCYVDYSYSGHFGAAHLF